MKFRTRIHCFEKCSISEATKQLTIDFWGVRMTEIVALKCLIHYTLSPTFDENSFDEKDVGYRRY